MSFAAVSITVTPNNVNFGEVSIKGKTEVQGSVTFDVTYSGLQPYCSVYYEDVTMPSDGASFWIDGTKTDGVIYGGDTYTEAEGAGLTLKYYADKAGNYTGKIRFYSYEDANWEVESPSVYLTIQLVVTGDAIVDTTTPFERINTTSELQDGDVIVFVSESAGAVCGPLNGTYLTQVTENVTVTKATGKADVPETAQTFVAKKYSGNWQFIYPDDDTKALLLDYSSNSGKGAFSTTYEAGKTVKSWEVNISNGVAEVIRPNDADPAYPIRFNSDRFKPYKSASTGTDIAIYKKAGEAQELQSSLTIGDIVFGEVEQDEPKDVTVNYTAENLTDDIIWEIEGTDAGLFDVTATGNRTSGTVTVKYLGTATKTGALNAKLAYLTQDIKLDPMEGSKTVSITLIPATVKLTNLAFNGAPTTIDQGQTIDMSQYLVFTPSNAEDKSLTWTTDHDYQGTVDADGKLTAKKVTGTVTVTATSVRVPSVSASTTLTIVKPTITDFTLSDTEVTLGVGGTKTISITAFVPSYASEKATFASADKTIATVGGSNGLITAKAIGETDVTATIGEVVKTCKVKVIATSVESIVLQEEATLTKGSSLQLTPVVTPAQAATDHGITYASDNNEVATVSEDGLVKGIAAGEATITATCDGISAQIAIHVVEPALFAKVTDPSTLAEKDTIILATIFQGNGVIAGPQDGKKLTVLTSDVTVNEEGAYADNALRMVLLKLKNKTGLALQPVGSEKVLAEQNNDLYLEKTTSTKNLTWQFVADGNNGIYVQNIGNTNAYFKYHEGNAAIKPYKVNTTGAVYVYVYVRKYVKPEDPVVTSIESNQPSANSCQKILRDGQLLIIRNGEIYTATGMKR